MTLDLTSAQQTRLEAIAARSHVSPQEILRRDFGDFLNYRETFVAAVEEGIDAAERGELHDHEEVMAMVDRILAEE